MNKKLMVIVTAVMALVMFVLGAYFYNAKQVEEANQLAQAESKAFFDRPNSPSTGSDNAKVQITEFFDPACEACRQIYPYVKSLLNANTDKVKLTLRYAAFHPGSDYVVQILEAIRMQGKDLYWKSLDAVLKAQPEWASHDAPNPKLVWNALNGLGIDLERVRKDMNDPRIIELIKQDAADITALKISQTPSFFVNGKPLVQFGKHELKALVQGEVEAAYKNN